MFIKKSDFDSKPIKKKNSRSVNVSIRKISIIILSVLALIYIGFSIFFTNHFYFKTYINESNCSGKSIKKLQNLVIEKSDAYTLQIKGREGLSDTISSKDIELTPEFAGEFEGVLKQQNPLLWPISIINSSNYEIETVVSYSKDKLDNLIDQLSFFEADNIRKPVNAYMSDYTQDGYTIIAEDKGTAPVREMIYDVIEEAVDVLDEAVDLDQENCYIEPEITSENQNLVKLCNNLNQYVTADIVYQFGNDQVEVNGEKIKDWLKIEDTKVTLDEELVREFVNSVARKYDTFGKTREFQTTSGNKIEVSGGAYGWWMDRAAETEELCEDIKAGNKTERTPVYRATAVEFGDQDYGDSYVEIDLTKQHLWVYRNGQIVVESDFVSGNVTKGNGTPTGVYGITYKERDATLKGENYSSDVSYWMPFNGNIGMHDASWRSSFGGEIYLTSGSHGCVNLPVKKAATIYDCVEKGEAVIVYGGKTTVSSANLDPFANLTEEQKIALLIQAGLLNPDGTPIENSGDTMEVPIQ